MSSVGALGALDRTTVDARFHIRGPRSPLPGLVIVAVDEKTLADLNVRTPIPRRLYARLLDRLRSAGARLVAIDVQFAHPSHPDDDRALAEAIARDGPVILATHDAPGGPVPVPAGLPRAPGAVPASIAIEPDADGVVRRMLYAPVRLPTFPIRTAEVLRGRSVGMSGFAANRAWIDFRGPPETFPTVSLSDVLAKDTVNRSLRGKIVLVGVTDPAAKDVFRTSASPDPMPGVELLANALATVLTGLPLRPVEAPLTALLLLALTGIPALVTARWNALRAAVAAVGSVVLLLVLVQLAFDAGRIVPLIWPLVGLALSLLGSAGVDFAIERRRRRSLESRLAEFPADVSPDFFISYRRDQSSWPARILRDELVRRFDATSVFMDFDSIAPGEEWPKQLEDAVRSSSVVLVLIGPYWLHARSSNGTRRIDEPDDWVRREVETALAAPNTTVVPVLHDGAEVPDEELLPPSLKPLVRRNAFTFAADNWSAQIDTLVGSMRDGRLRELVFRDHHQHDGDTKPSTEHEAT
jgi:CHASE2 domain-containing sensor protein